MPNMDYKKTCTNCSKIKVCKFFMQVSQFKEGFEEQAGDIVRLPMLADSIAMTCTEYDGEILDEREQEPEVPSDMKVEDLR